MKLKKKWKNGISLLLTVVMSLLTPITVMADYWQGTTGSWQYIVEKEEQQELTKNCWKKIKNDWFHFNSDGLMDTGWYKDKDEKWYYLNKLGEGTEGALRTSWYKDINGNWYYLNRSEEGTEGSLRTGWFKDGSGKWYYLNKLGEGIEGSLRTGWYQDSNGKWYYLEPTDGPTKGVMKTGWIYDGTERYYLGLDGAWIPGYGELDDENDNSDDENINSSVEDEIQIINTKNNVIAFDSTTKNGLLELKQVYDGIWDYWIDDMNTEDWSDDEYNVVVENNNPLLDYILNGTYQKGDVIFIPACEYFPTGVSLIYQYHDDAYKPDMQFSNEKFEVIHTKKATLEDIIEEEINFSSNEFEQENPIAFIWTPEYEIDTVEIETASFTSVEYNNKMKNTDTETKSINESINWGAPSSVKGAGIQFQNFSTIFIPTADFSDILGGKIALKMNDIILYDGDGNKNTKYDRIVLSGELTLENIHPELVLDWNPQLSDPLPKQFMAKLTYNENNNVKFAVGGEVSDLKEIFKEIKKRAGSLTHNNKRSIFGMDIEGVDMDIQEEDINDMNDSIVLGAIGWNVAASNVKFNIKSIRDQSIKLPLAPTFLIFLTLNINGKVEATVVGEYNYSSYIEKGVNVQKDGYIGNHGTCAENKGQKNYKIGNRNINIYDLKAKSKTEKNKEPVANISITANGKGEVNAGAGPGVGMMIAGIIPLMGKATIDLESSATANGKVSISSETGVDIEGELSCNLALVFNAKFLFKLTAKTILGNPGIQGEWKWKYTFLQWNLTTQKLNGQVLESDYDRDNTNNPKLMDALVEITQKTNAAGTSHNHSIMTDEEGNFEISGLANGDYILKVTKNGYLIYDTELEVKANMDDLTIFLDKDDIQSNISGIVKEADMDSDISNNKSLSEVKVTINKISSSTTKIQSIVTDKNGNYNFDKLPSGLYEITFEKNGYITVRDEIKVTTSTSVYNATMEIISNDHSGYGIATGKIIDSITGQNVGSGIIIKVTEGSKISDTEVITTTQTDENGQYELTLAAGIYTLWISDNSIPKKYMDDSFVIKVLGNITIDNQNGEMVPLLNTDEIRIVLTWGSYPRDLDSHLTGPTGIDRRFHVFYNNKKYFENMVCMANLDLDNTSSYGPETITINCQSDGIYRFAVHDYTNRNCTNSMQLAESGAYVRIYRDGYSETETYAVPYVEGTVWNVFDYDSRTGVITPINTMEYENNPNFVGQVGNSGIKNMSDEDNEQILLKDYELAENNKYDERSDE